MTTHFQPSPTYGDEGYEPDTGPAPPGRNGGPPRRTLAGAIRRHWILALIPVVVLAAAGGLAGAKKKPTYSATATINVGKSDIATQATPGYLVAAEAMASSYSRLVTSQNIVQPAGRAVGESPATAASQLSAVPIPNEPTFTITATGSSSAGAAHLARAAVSALQHYANASATQQGGPAQLMSKYKAAQREAIQDQQHVGFLQGQRAKDTALGLVPSVSKAKLTQAKVAAQTANLKAQALSNQYTTLSQSGVAPKLDVLYNPTAASSTNRTTNIEKYAVIGAVAGIIIGCAFAALAEALSPRRRRAAAY